MIENFTGTKSQRNFLEELIFIGTKIFLTLVFIWQKIK